MKRLSLIATVLVLTVVPSVVAAVAPQADPGPRTPPPQPDFAKLGRSSVERGLAVLQKSAATFVVRRDCFSCHHQGLAAMAVDAARLRGFPVDAKASKALTDDLKTQIGRLAPLLASGQADDKVDFILVDPLITTGYVFSAWKANRLPAEDMASLARYALRKQGPDGCWPVIASRPPHESSDFSSTALIIRGVKEYASDQDRDRAAVAIGRARAWLTSAPAKSLEDLAFRLMGLAWAGAPESEVAPARSALLAEQRDDGGWAQLQGKASDAYATAVAMVALAQSGYPVSSGAYRRGYFWLLVNQKHAEGSWHVITRSPPVQPYFETGFPHGKDQFISAAATAWAVMAMLPLAEAPTVSPARAATASPAARPSKPSTRPR